MSHLLRRASRLWGMQTSYLSADRKIAHTEPETLKTMLKLLSGREIESDDDLTWLIDQARTRKIKRVLDSAYVVTKRSKMRIYLPEEFHGKALELHLKSEEGKDFSQDLFLAGLHRPIKCANVQYSRMNVEVSFELAPGYYTASLTHAGQELAKSFVLVPPTFEKSKTPPKQWGFFAPLYGVYSANSLGIGDLGDMGSIQETISRHGASFFGTLPLLPTAHGREHFDPSPYSPLSRIFWNEIYLDLAPLIATNERANQLVNEPSFQEELARLRNESYVDHAAVYRLKKSVIEILAADFFAGEQHGEAAYREFAARTPDLMAYAESRRENTPYHCYVQFQMDKQLRELKERADQNEIAGLYLDFPVGVNRAGYDSQFYAESFLNAASAGAPPDPFFIKGQNWGFAPFHPLGLRESRYQYLLKALRHHMRYAKVLRIDHVMGLHRIYAVPEGHEATDGVYLRYRTDELFALVAIEAERFGVRIVGEDLGTVPDAVREALKKYEFLHMWVLPFEASQDAKKKIRRAPEKCLACVNTHDMFPFAGHLRAHDIDFMERLGFLDDDAAATQRRDRKKTTAYWLKELGAEKKSELLKKMVKRMAKSPAELMLLTLEDMWGEREPQNVPGTQSEYPNWTRKLKFSTEEWSENLNRTMHKISRWRQSAAHSEGKSHD